MLMCVRDYDYDYEDCARVPILTRFRFRLRNETLRCS